jgi:predicted ribosomally synthesized peptide with SipW-like signal peptide
VRRILFPLLVIGLAGGLFTLGSGAFFSDTETDTGNIITAGSLNLTLTDPSENGTDSETETWVFPGVKPGDSGTASLTINNTGSLSGFLDLSSIAVVDNENTCIEPEGDATCGATDGELGANLDVKVCWDVDGDGDCDDDGVIIYVGKLNAIAAAYNTNRAIANGASTTLTMEWSIGNGVGNIIQTDSSAFSFTVELDQTAD